VLQVSCLLSVSNARESETQQLSVNILDDDSFPSADTLSFDLQTDKTDYVVGETVWWEAWVSLSDVQSNNFGIHTVSFDLAEDRSERMNQAAIGSEFADYSLNGKGLPHRGSLQHVGAGQLGYDAAVVEVTRAEPGPTMLAQGSFIATRAGTHTLSLTPSATSFYAVGSGFAGKAYSSLVGDSESFIVGGSSAPTVRLSVDRSEMSETGGVAFVSATLSTVLDEDVRVDLGFSGTATNDEDYTSSTHIVITAGNLRSISQLTALPDQSVEGNETILLDVVAVNNALEAGTQQVSVSIVDDDHSSAPLDTLRFDLQTDKTDYVTGEMVQWQVLVSVERPTQNFGIHTVSFDLTENRSEAMDQATMSPEFADYSLRSTGHSGEGSLRQVSARQLGFDAAVVEVTALAPGPTLLAAGSFTLTTPGEHSLSLTPTSSRFFSVSTGSALNRYSSQIGDSVSFVVAAGATPTVFLNVDEVKIAEAGGVATLTAELSHASTQDVTVDLAFAGTASKFVDYTPSSPRIVIPAGNLSATAQVTAINDGHLNAGETIIVEINEVTHGVEAGQQQLTMVIIDSSPAERDSLVFGLRTDKHRYTVGDTVHWSTYVSLQNGSVSNFGIHTVSFDLDQSRSEDLNPATVSYAFRNYDFREGRVSGGSLVNVLADLDIYYPGIVQVTGANPESTLLASGVYTVTSAGFHSLTLRPQTNDFFTTGSDRTTRYASLTPATVSFVVATASSGLGGPRQNSQNGSGNSSSPGDSTTVGPSDENVAVEGDFLSANTFSASRGNNQTRVEPTTTLDRTSAVSAALASWSDDDLSTALINLGAITDAHHSAWLSRGAQVK